MYGALAWFTAGYEEGVFLPLWGFLLSFLAAALWAASPIMVNHGLAVSKCTTNDINPIRSIAFFLPSLAIAFVWGGGSIPVMLSPLAWFYIFTGVFISYMLGDILYFMAIREIGVSLAVPVANAYPILVAISSWIILGEALTMKLMWGILIVVAGLLLLRFGGGEQADGSALKAVLKDKRRLLKGFGLSAAAGLMWAISSPITKLSIMASGLDAVNITFYRSIAFLVIAWAIRLFVARRHPEEIVPLWKIPPRATLYFLGAAFIGLCLGSIIYAGCIAVMPVAIVTAITATSPFIAALFGHFFMKERLSRLQWGGIMLTIIGSVVVGL